MLFRKSLPGLVLAAFVLVLGALWQPVPAYADDDADPKPITHPLTGTMECLPCHKLDGVRPMPQDHNKKKVSSCLDCHDPTDEVARASAKEGELDVAVLSQDCRTCHDKVQFKTVSRLDFRRDTSKELESERVYAHRFQACVTCHGKQPHQTLAPVTKTSIAEACGKCHVEQFESHRASIHGKSLKEGGKDAATCIDCHSTGDNPHSIVRVLSPQSPAYRTTVADTCARCHSKPDVMHKYKVETVVYQTYLSNFHGKANVLSPYEITQHPKAACINCHGYHDIRPKDDPESPVAPANLPQTCGGCHPGAGSQFAASWMGHKEASPEQYPVVYFAERFFFVLTSTVLTCGFIFMVLLDLINRFRKRHAHAAAAS